jgi:hypothetical protein
MSNSTKSEHGPDITFLRMAGLLLAILALSAGTVSLIGISVAQKGAEIEIAEARALEQGAAAMFRSVDENIAERHQLDFVPD